MNIAARANPIQTADDPLPRNWRWFGRIYCISLSTRVDRQDQAAAGFRAVGLSGMVEFAIVEKHPAGSEQGIFESHMACLRAGLEAGARSIVVFEDDVQFHRFSPHVLGDVIQFMQTHPTWELFLFGGWINSFRRTTHASVLKVQFRCAAHAYVVSRAFAERLVEQPWQGIAYDDLLRKLGNDNAYACRPLFAFQSGSPTDNVERIYIDRMRHLLGGSRLLQRWNEFSTYHYWGLVGGHVLFFMVAALLAVLFLRGR